ncbi:IclR family transcriptional regulator [Halopenitus sp. H-Gu1]|uniref:IclR family transcriptional regulator n=1 Tax=Halopenitus sp. H-Gu1 TaxID=3242697 RepID=UPI00359E4544
MATSDSKRIEAVRNTCRIVDVLKDRGRCGVTEISDELDFSKSAVHAHLATLREEGLVVKTDREYGLSLEFLDLAEHAKGKLADQQITQKVRELADETGEAVHFGTEEQGQVVYTAKSYGDAAVKTASRIGKRMPMHSTSLGKAMLSEFPREQVDRIIDEHGLPARTDSTITDREELHEELQRTRERGYSIDDAENIPGVRCIGMSVCDPDGDVLGGLSVSGPLERMTDDRLEEDLYRTLAQATNIIEVNTMYS